MHPFEKIQSLYKDFTIKVFDAVLEYEKNYLVPIIRDKKNYEHIPIDFEERIEFLFKYLELTFPINHGDLSSKASQILDYPQIFTNDFDRKNIYSDISIRKDGTGDLILNAEMDDEPYLELLTRTRALTLVLDEIVSVEYPLKQAIESKQKRIIKRA